MSYIYIQSQTKEREVVVLILYNKQIMWQNFFLLSQILIYNHYIIL